MNNPICLATGTFFKLFPQETYNNHAVDIFKEFEIDGIEITVGRTTQVPSISQANKAYLKTLKHTSIHSPFSIKYEKHWDTEELVRKLGELYTDIGAKNIVIHPDQIDDYRLFAGMAYSTENLSRTKNLPIQRYADLLQQFPELKLTLDCGHALSISAKELETLVEKFSDRVVQIHFHDYRNGDDHQPFSTTDNAHKYDILKQFKVPVVIEEMFDRLDLDLLKREIDCVREYFSK